MVQSGKSGYDEVAKEKKWAIHATITVTVFTALFTLDVFLPKKVRSLIAWNAVASSATGHLLFYCEYTHIKADFVPKIS